MTPLPNIQPEIKQPEPKEMTQDQSKVLLGMSNSDEDKALLNANVLDRPAGIPRKELALKGRGFPGSHHCIPPNPLRVETFPYPSQPVSRNQLHGPIDTPIVFDWSSNKRFVLLNNQN